MIVSTKSNIFIFKIKSIGIEFNQYYFLERIENICEALTSMHPSLEYVKESNAITSSEGL